MKIPCLITLPPQYSIRYAGLYFCRRGDKKKKIIGRRGVGGEPRADRGPRAEIYTAIELFHYVLKTV